VKQQFPGDGARRTQAELAAALSPSEQGYLSCTATPGNR
jgi:hypothetical protein